jgi:hypothetical protein
MGMHFVVHWGPQTGNNVGAAAQADLRKVLAPYSWVQPITNFYIVNVVSSAQYQQVATALNTTAQKYPTQVHLIISPPMTAGTYTGFLPENLWAEINKRSA